MYKILKIAVYFIMLFCIAVKRYLKVFQWLLLFISEVMDNAGMWCEMVWNSIVAMPMLPQAPSLSQLANDSLFNAWGLLSVAANAFAKFAGEIEEMGFWAGDPIMELPRRSHNGTT